MILCNGQVNLKALQRLERPGLTISTFTKEIRMSMIASVPGIAPTLKIVQPEEFCPIALLDLAIKKFRVKCYEFAVVFGIEAQTISAWRCGSRVPTRQNRIRAASLKKEWGMI